MCLGEMAVYAPISGGYIHFAERWVNPAVGFAVGWQVTIQYCISMPSEMIAANILCSYWDNSFPVSHQGAYLTTFIVLGSLIVSEQPTSALTSELLRRAMVRRVRILVRNNEDHPRHHPDHRLPCD